MVKFDEIAKSACVSQQTSAVGVANLLVLPLHSILMLTRTPTPPKIVKRAHVIVSMIGRRGAQLHTSLI